MKIGDVSPGHRFDLGTATYRRVVLAHNQVLVENTGDRTLEIMTEGLPCRPVDPPADPDFQVQEDPMKRIIIKATPGKEWEKPQKPDPSQYGHGRDEISRYRRDCKRWEEHQDAQESDVEARRRQPEHPPPVDGPTFCTCAVCQEIYRARRAAEEPPEPRPDPVSVVAGHLLGTKNSFSGLLRKRGQIQKCRHCDTWRRLQHFTDDWPDVCIPCQNKE